MGSTLGLEEEAIVSLNAWLGQMMFSSMRVCGVLHKSPWILTSGQERWTVTENERMGLASTPDCPTCHP